LKYNRTLAQRNKLLKNSFDYNYFITLLEPYNHKLEEYATTINRMRREFIKDFLPYFQSFYDDISKTKETVNIIYETELDNNDLNSLLKKNLQKDMALGHTTCGTHREDFSFYINDYPLKKFGSQGQQKSFLIALKLAKHRYISKKKNNIPILLLDDLHDKLDANRVEHLFEMLNSNEFNQVFITDTQKERLDPLMTSIKNSSCFFYIENGIVKNN
jgi:DNA replication and repair protein RecF